MLHWNTFIWIAILLGTQGIIELLPITGARDFYGLLIISFVLFLTWNYLGVRTQFRSFLFGVILYWLGEVVDWLDSLFHVASFMGKTLNTLDDMLFTAGFFFIGLAFIRLMLERDQLENKFYQQAYQDELTELGNRRALFKKLEAILATQAGALLYIDINLFKQVNDQFGHDRGDLALRDCAALLKQSSGLAYRIGGDEFVLLLSNEDPTQTAEQLQQNVQALTAEYGISFSIGIAPFTAKSYGSPDELLAFADQAMYSAKQRFRAQSRVAARSE